MKPVLYIVFMLVCLTILNIENASAVQLLKPAPDFALGDLNGATVKLSDLKGKVVILNFWSTTCAPCVAEIPSLNTLYRELKGSGVVVLGISLDRSVKPVRELAEKLRIAYPLLMDSQQDVYFDSYALFGQPVSVIIDRSGIVQDKMMGQIEWSSAKIRAKLLRY